MTGVSLLVVALAVAAVLSIVGGSDADDPNKRLVTDLVGVDGQGGETERSTGADLGR